MTSIKKRFNFDAAHRLINLPDGHKCRSLHGHHYDVDVTISTNNNFNNMVIDFNELKPFQSWLDVNFDHSTILNPDDTELFEFLKRDKHNRLRYMPSGDPTAENMAKFFKTIVYELIKSKLENFEVTVEVFETRGSSAMC